ncbi:MAG: hypothetical protein AAFO95_12105 [Cyanobacteria bacterium J06600_6]
MFIHDLEFINSYNECSKASAVKGGAIAETYSNVDLGNGSVFADANAVGVGEIASAAVTGSRAVSVEQKRYSTGYGVAYGTAYGVDKNYGSAQATSYSYGIV